MQSLSKTYVFDMGTDATLFPWYTFEHKGRSGENIPNGNSFGPEHFLLEHHRNNLPGPDNQVRCREFRSLQMMVLVLFLLVECV